MSTILEIGSMCEDCMHFGQQNYLKAFYINPDEQIVKCESSQCMFPYLRKPSYSDLTNSKPPSENTTICLDEFIAQSLCQIDEQPPPAKVESQFRPTKVEKITSNDFDYSTLYDAHPIKSEIKEKPMFFVKQEKQEQNSLPIVFKEPARVLKNPCKMEDSKAVNRTQAPKKARISRCFTDIKANPKSLNAKKKVSEKIEPVLVVEPQSGKSMRPLDLIMRYVRKKP